MANRIRFAVSAIPIETITDENAGTHDIIASEVGTSLGASGDSLTITAYNGTAANQGFLNGVVNYKMASHAIGGTKLSNTNTPDFVYVENTGFKFSSATVLGAATTDCVLLVSSDETNNLYHEIAWLQPGQGVLLPAGANAKGITLLEDGFGGNGGDLTAINDPGYTVSYLYVRTFQSDGSLATSGNAVKYLVVT